MKPFIPMPVFGSRRAAIRAKYYHISYTFEIPKEYKVLEVLLEYEPEKRTNPPKDLEKEVREAARTEIFRKIAKRFPI